MDPSRLNILFVQDSSPCIRNIKYTEALSSKGFQIHLLYKNRDPNTGYGYGNSFYKSLTKYKYTFSFLRLINLIIRQNNIQLIHYHNQPDLICAKLIKANLGIPIVYDCHDFLSFKHHLSHREKNAERICNEQASGVIYPAQSYLDAAKQYYNFTKLQLVFGNYFPQGYLLEESEFASKLSSKDGKIHLVYQGRIAEKESDHRYLVNQFRQIDDTRFVIHLYPSNHKEFAAYQKIPNLVLHNKLPYADLIREISAYDYGLVCFNDTIIHKLPAIKYAFGNKTFDYLCAGLPIVVQDSLTEVANFVKNNGVGIMMSELNKLTLNQFSDTLVKQVLQIREQYSMDNQIDNLIKFYDEVIEAYHA